MTAGLPMTISISIAARENRMQVLNTCSSRVRMPLAGGRWEAVTRKFAE
jgi:hypothetical protein